MSLDTPPKIAAVLAVIAYVIGVLTVSIYVQHNDIPAPDLTVFRANYIYTGLEVLGLLALATAVVHIPMVGGNALGRWARVGLIPVCFIGLLIGYAGILERGLTGAKLSTALLPVFLSLVVGGTFLLGWTLILPRRTLRFRTRWGPTPDVRLPALVVLGLTGLATTVWFVSQYSLHIYRLIPHEFGGGEPQKALVVFTKEGAAQAEQTGIPIRPGTEKSEPVSILLVDASYYALRAHNGPVVQISKSSVAGLQVDRTRPSAVDVQTRDRSGHPGRVELGDHLVLIYSETMRPASLVPSWTGEEPLRGAIQLKSVPGAKHRLQFVDSESTRQPALGTVGISAATYAHVFGKGPHNVTLRQQGPKIVVTLEKPAPHTQQTIDPDVLTWTPSRTATDLAGNHCRPSSVSEQSHRTIGPADDADF